MLHITTKIIEVSKDAVFTKGNVLCHDEKIMLCCKEPKKIRKKNVFKYMGPLNGVPSLNNLAPCVRKTFFLKGYYSFEKEVGHVEMHTEFANNKGHGISVKETRHNL